MSRKDVELVIRAKDEATRALQAITGALGQFATASNNLDGAAADSVIGRLGTELGALQRQIQGLTAYKKLVAEIDRVVAAGARLESEVAAQRAEVDRLGAAHAKAAASTANLRQESEQAAAAFAAQKAQAAAVAADSGRKSDAYRIEAAALDALRQKRSESLGALRGGEREERKLSGALEEGTAELQRRSKALEQAKADLDEMVRVSAEASAKLGGVAASPAAVGQAIATAQARARNTEGAIDFHADAERNRLEFERVKRLRDIEHALRAQAEAEREAKAVADFQAEAERNRRLIAEADYIRDVTAALQAREQAEREQADTAAAAAALRAQLNPLGVALDRINDELERARSLYAKGAIDARELAAAERMLAMAADDARESMAGQGWDRKQGNFLGLRPYELTNLSYQINDIFTQIASGTSVAQVAAQQGGQVFQIFGRQMQGVLPAIARASPYLAAVGVALGVVYAALDNILDQAESARKFFAILEVGADAALHNASALADAAHELDVYGGSLKDARTAIQTFLTAGVNDAFIEEFGKTAQDLASVLGKDLPDAAKLMADGLTAGYDQVRKLDEEIGFLTVTQREEVRLLYESGRASEARAKALELLKERTEKAAAALRTPLGDSVRNATRAWNGFLEAIGRSDAMQLVVDRLTQMAKDAEKLSKFLPGAAEGAENLQDRLGQRRSELIAERATALARTGQGGMPQGRGLTQRARPLGEIDAELAKLDARIAEIQAKAGDTVDDASEKRRKIGAELVRQAQAELAEAKGLTAEQRLQLRQREAYGKALSEGADEASARLIADLARQKEMLAIEKDRRKAAEERAQAEERAVKSATNKIIGVEAGRNKDGSLNPAAGNPNSSALGLGQFIESTWLSLFKKHFPDRAKGMSDAAVLALRKDAEISRAMVELFVRDNADLLRKAGLAVTEANLYLMHFLGEAAAPKVIRAPAGAPIGDLVGRSAVAANPGVFGKNDTAGELRAWAARKMGVSEQEVDAAQQVAAAIDKIAEKAAEARDEFDGWLTTTRAETALLDAQNAGNEERVRVLTIEKDVSEQIAAAREKGLTLSDQDLANLRETAAAAYDTANAERLRNEAAQAAEDRRQKAIETVDTEIGLLDQRRQSLLDQIALAEEASDAGQADALRAQLALLDEDFQRAIDHAIAFYQALGGPDAETAILNLQSVRVELAQTSQQITLTAADADRLITDTLTNGWDGFFSKIEEGKDVFTALRESMAEMAADFFRQIAQMIVQALAWKAIMASGLGEWLSGGVNGVTGTGAAPGAPPVAPGAPPVAPGAPPATPGTGQDLVVGAAAVSTAGETVSDAAGTLGQAGATVGAGATSMRGAATGLGAGAAQSLGAGALLMVAAQMWKSTAAELQKAALLLMAANAAKSASSGGMFHSGGVVGYGGGRSRMVMPGWFNNAVRYHSGGIVGLRPSEMPAILERGEEVLTSDDPRHILNGAGSGSGGAPLAVKIINALDAGEVLSKGLDTRSGEEAIINKIAANAGEINAILGRR